MSNFFVIPKRRRLLIAHVIVARADLPRCPLFVAVINFQDIHDANLLTLLSSSSEPIADSLGQQAHSLRATIGRFTKFGAMRGPRA